MEITLHPTMRREPGTAICQFLKQHYAELAHLTSYNISHLLSQPSRQIRLNQICEQENLDLRQLLYEDITAGGGRLGRMVLSLLHANNLGRNNIPISLLS
jgi:hypothetical protein